MRDKKRGNWRRNKTPSENLKNTRSRFAEHWDKNPGPTGKTALRKTSTLGNKEVVSRSRASGGLGVERNQVTIPIWGVFSPRRLKKGRDSVVHQYGRGGYGEGNA